MGERLFHVLFKYPRLVFQQGEFTWAVSRPLLIVVGLAAAGVVAALLTYRRVGTLTSTRDRTILIALRLAVLALLAFCLLRPTLVLKAAVPQQNFLGVLLDDSRSMAIADRGNETRGAFVEQQFGGKDGALLRALSQRFVLRFFRFSSSAARTDTAAALTFDGTATRLGPALDRARDELAGLPLAGLVMVTDGADTSDAAIDGSLASLKARSIPVFTVGVGRDHFAKDIQVTRVETPRTALKGTSLVVDVVLSQTGYRGQTVPLTVEDDGRIVSTQDVTLPDNGEAATVKVPFTVTEAGPRTFRFSIPVQPGEEVTQNNVRDALIEVGDSREKVLYFEGEPRFEMKFIRRAVEDDKNLALSILQRTAENKYYRVVTESPEELVGGFPKTREELFAYRAIILGSIEAAAFTPEQMRMLADFISKRGGGLLMLGGRRSFAEGGWAGTPLAEALPVVLDANGGRPATAYFSPVHARPTRAGALYPVTQAAEGDKATTKWEDLPPVTSVNSIHEAKPGATVLLSGTDNRKQEQIVLAYQRYGRGKALAMPIQDSFLWYMNPKVPVSDKTHSTFWRRLVRWLVDGVPGQVNVTTTQDRVEPGEPIKLAAEVLDAAYVEVNDSRVVAHVTSPSGKSSDVPLEWIVEHDGDYRGSFVPDETGLYEITVSASRPANTAGRPSGGDGDRGDLTSNVIHVRAAAGDGEYFDAAMRAPLLQRVADETGGHFFTEANAASLPEAISYSGRGVTVVEERELWDMPIILILLIGLAGAEWAFRRTRGLA
ncbi:MAG TPA: glutamine amidotransferase [Vicinamibacterales bacterium]|nr:glutamine amidotransferase [Vicinamibacterales bacterium]